MIIDYRLTYPSGTATAHLINSFHTPQGAKLARYPLLFSSVLLLITGYNHTNMKLIFYIVPF